MDSFRKVDGTPIDDLGQYCREYMKKYPDVRIHVGCDSENNRRKSNYGISVCFRHPSNGVHLIRRIERLKKIRDIFSRLWKEVEYVVEVCEYLEGELNGHYPRENPDQKLVYAHLDLSSNKKYKSSRVYDAGVGYLKGLGYQVYAKPDAWAASVAADAMCRK